MADVPRANFRSPHPPSLCSGTFSLGRMLWLFPSPEGEGNCVLWNHNRLDGPITVAVARLGAGEAIPLYFSTLQKLESTPRPGAGRRRRLRSSSPCAWWRTNQLVGSVCGMMQPDMTPEIYPNSPLQGVVFEIRFPGEPAVECHRDQFFEDVRKEFPQVLVPKLQEGAAAALSPYHFQSADGTKALLTALNLFAFRTSQYPGYAAFKDEALRWCRLFATRFSIDKLSRTGLRYTNVIPYPPGQGFPLHRFLQIQMSLGGGTMDRLENLYITSRMPAANGALTLNVGSIKGEQGEDAILLDFDFARTEGLRFAEIERHLDESHDETKQLFESLLTHEYRSYMRGEELP